SQGRDEGSLFESMLDTNGPDTAPKNEPTADKSERAERPAPTQRATDTDHEPRDPAANAATETAPDPATSVDGAETQASAETEALIETANAAIDTSQTVKTDEAAAALAVTVEPVVPQPVVAPVVASVVAIAAAPVATDAAANADAASVAPAGATALPTTIEAAPQTAPAEAATPEALPAEAKPQIAKTAGEKPAEEKPADGKVKAQPKSEDGAIAPKPLHSDAGEKKAAPAADGPAKPETPAAKPKVELETPRADNLASQRDNTAIPNADKADIVTLATVQAQAVHATGPASSAGRGEQAAVAVPVAGLAVEIAAQARAGKNRFEIRLDPPELGRIDVRLDMDKDGNVTSRLTVERADTLDLLRRDAQQLERALNQAGLKTADNALEFQLRDHGFANNDNKRENARDGAQVIIPDDDAAVLDAKRGYGRLLGLGNGLDISV
ncbi:MAG TPA: flagellar hook-length control protein FliK, partial [Pseudorhodoplanes sp.]|nr:flagellar hook-length control protein FliK [Pseudorhodoplanes sp.]